MKAVILTAGVGSRIRPLTDNKPKSLIEVAGKSILARMVESILLAGIKDIVLVTGYRAEQIKQFLFNTFPRVPFNFVFNERYGETNTAYSLLMTKKLIGESEFIKFDADVVFEIEILKRLLESKNSALCIDRNIRLETEEVKVITTSRMRVLEVGKKITPTLAHGESIGIEKLDKKATSVLFSELEDLLKDKSNWQEYYDDCYTALVKKGIIMEAVDITGLKWVEIDNHRDLEAAERIFKI